MIDGLAEVKLEHFLRSDDMRPDILSKLAGTKVTMVIVI